MNHKDGTATRLDCLQQLKHFVFDPIDADHHLRVPTKRAQRLPEFHDVHAVPLHVDLSPLRAGGILPIP
jgi:hypothetical protein